MGGGEIEFEIVYKWEGVEKVYKYSYVHYTIMLTQQQYLHDMKKKYNEFIKWMTYVIKIMVLNLLRRIMYKKDGIALENDCKEDILLKTE